MRRIYLDHAAGKPVDPRVIDAMMPYFNNQYGNPSSTHTYGSEARDALETARTQVAKLIGAEKPNEIIFTSGATEANNLAIKGVANRLKKKGSQVIISSIEHISTFNICKSLQKQGFTITKIPVDDKGIVDTKTIRDNITDDTILISIVYANGEIGTIQPIEEISQIAREMGVYLHTDAVAAGGTIPINVQTANVDLMTISSNDMYGPKGVGALYIRKGTKIQSVMQGGGQERGLRSGSENIPGIVGMGYAADIAKKELPGEMQRLTDLRDYLIKGLLDNIDHSYLNGHPIKRLPNNANVRFSFIEGEGLLLSLDALGIQVSSGSACTSKTLQPSHVLIATGISHEQAHGSLIFTLGRQNSKEHLDYVIEVLPAIVDRLRSISPLTPKN